MEEKEKEKNPGGQTAFLKFNKYISVSSNNNNKRQGPKPVPLKFLLIFFSLVYAFWCNLFAVKQTNKQKTGCLNLLIHWNYYSFPVVLQSQCTCTSIVSYASSPISFSLAFGPSTSSRHCYILCSTFLLPCGSPGATCDSFSLWKACGSINSIIT